ncbi:MAG: Uma2 family endonuclease [Aquificota bacterium]|nr:MAG: Uma2 family endonuclease [Aquificota bacterium]
MSFITTSKKHHTSKPQVYRFSIKDLEKMYEAGLFKPEEKVELINGEIIMMAPIGFRHAKTLEKLEKIFYEILFKKGLSNDFVIWTQNPVKRNNKDLLYPGLAIYPSDIYKKDDIPKIKDAELIIEVSDTTLEYDKEIKLPVYAKGNAKGVWIVNIEDNLLETYKNPSGKIFKDIKIFKKDEILEIFGEKINLSKIF